MINIVQIIVIGFRLFLAVKVGFLLIMCYFFPEKYNILDLRWYMYFFVFDAWFMRVNDRYGKNED